MLRRHRPLRLWQRGLAQPARPDPRLADVGKRPAIAFAHDDHAFTLAVLIGRKAQIATMFFLVCRFDVATEIAAIHLDRAGKRLDLALVSHR